MPSSYPTSLDTATTLSTAVNGLSTPLVGDHAAGLTTITVTSSSGAPTAGYVYVDTEVIRYTGTTPTTLTGCTRGADGTSAAFHANGATVKFGSIADHHNSLAAAAIALQTKVGLNTNGATASTIDAGQLAANSTLTMSTVITGAGLRDSRANVSGATVMTKLDEVIVGGAVTFVQFSAINQNFRHLKILGQARGDAVAVAVSLSLQFSGDTGANYIFAEVEENNTTVSGTSGAGATSMIIVAISAASAPVNYPGGFEITIPNYSSTTFYKSALGFDTLQAGSGVSGARMDVLGGSWGNTAAITSIKILCSTGNLITSSIFSLYGLP